MIWIHLSRVRKPRRWNSAGWREDDRITSAVCLACCLFESLNQGEVDEQAVAGVSNSSFLLRFSYYKSAVRNKCFTCDLILCRRKHLGSTLWPDSLDCLESYRDRVNSGWCREKGPPRSLPPFILRALGSRWSSRRQWGRVGGSAGPGEGAQAVRTWNVLSRIKRAVSLCNIFHVTSF